MKITNESVLESVKAYLSNKLIVNANQIDITHANYHSDKSRLMIDFTVIDTDDNDVKVSKYLNIDTETIIDYLHASNTVQDKIIENTNLLNDKLTADIRMLNDRADRLASTNNSLFAQKRKDRKIISKIESRRAKRLIKLYETVKLN